MRALIRLKKDADVEAVLKCLYKYTDLEVTFGINMVVIADGKLIGKIKEVLDYPGNSVYVVSGEFEYMIPAVKQFVHATDLEANRMEVTLIEGMRTDEN